jgi:hypothetical protein
VRPQPVAGGAAGGAGPAEVLEGALVVADAHRADLVLALGGAALQQHHVAVLDAVGHRVAAHPQREPIAAPAHRQVPLGFGGLAHRQAGGDLAVHRHPPPAAEQRDLGAAPRAAGDDLQVPLRLQRTQVLAQGGVADAEAAREVGELGEPAVAFVRLLERA